MADKTGAVYEVLSPWAEADPIHYQTVIARSEATRQSRSTLCAIMGIAFAIGRVFYCGR